MGSTAHAILKSLSEFDKESVFAADSSKVPPRAPAPVVSLAEYVETVRKIKCDPWQVDLCKRLEEAFFHPGKRDFYHGPPQHGKTTIMSQAQPGWILGHDPGHRFRLATYNVLHSARFSVVVQRLMRSKEHLDIFPSIYSQIPPRCKVVEWSTYGRMAVNDGQSSFSALGLASGFTGTGFDTLVMDDPYKSVQEALSEVIRDRVWRFWDETARPRASLVSNVFGMFHRYMQDDIGGKAIAAGQFDYIRYAAQADGDYVDEESGRVFSDPLGRQEGEYLSPRYPASYYEEQKLVTQVWLSQFQGTPSDKAGGFFDITKLGEIEEAELPRFIHRVRAWDNASTEGAGAWTVGAGMGIEATGRVIIFDLKREQLNTAKRRALQESTARDDGRLVTQHFPQDPGSAGKDVAFDVEQMLPDYHVVTQPVTGTKEMRAYTFSQGVNRGDVYLVKAPWNKALKDEMKNFPLSTYKDQVDATSDAYRYLYQLFHRGLVLKTYDPEVHLLRWSAFEEKFGARKVPKVWDIQAAIRIENDASKPSGAAIIARAGQGTGWEDVVFVLAAMRKQGLSPDALAEWLTSNVARTARGELSQIWCPKESWHASEVLMQKHGLPIIEFPHDITAGIAELNWYMMIDERKSHHFLPRTGASRCYWLVADDQYENPTDEAGLLSLRQDAATWSYNDKGEVQPFGGVSLACLKTIMHAFPLGWANATPDELVAQHMPEEMKGENLKNFLHENQMGGYLALRQKVRQIIKEEGIEAPEDTYEGQKQKRGNFRNRWSR